MNRKTIVLGLIASALLGGATLLGYVGVTHIQSEINRTAQAQKLANEQLAEAHAKTVADMQAREEQNREATTQKQKAEALAARQAEDARRTAQEEARQELYRRLETLQKKIDDTAKHQQKHDETLVQIAAQAKELTVSGKTMDEATKAKLAALEAQLKAIRYPPLPEGEQPVFSCNFESVGVLKVERGDRAHLAVFLSWREPREKPSETLLTQLSSIYTDTGTKLEKVAALKGAEQDDGKALKIHDDDKGARKIWYVGWSRGKDDKPVAVMHLECYGDRVRVYWYKGRRDLSAEDKGKIRTRLLLLAATFDLPHGSASDWGEPVEGYSDLYLRK